MLPCAIQIIVFLRVSLTSLKLVGRLAEEFMVEDGKILEEVGILARGKLVLSCDFI